MNIDFLGMASSLWQVLAVGLLFGAGLPALFSLGIRALGRAPESMPDVAGTGSSETGTAAGGAGGAQGTHVVGGSRFLAYVCFGLCVVVALFGIVVIVFGKQLFG